MRHYFSDLANVLRREASRPSFRTVPSEFVSGLTQTPGSPSPAKVEWLLLSPCLGKTREKSPEAKSMFPQSSHALTVSRALVTANKDPQKLGRVQVRYPHYLGNSSEMSTQWARVCQPYGSSENGAWFLPDVGDEVLVAFESSNVDNPIVVGSLYGEKNKPPTSGLSGDYNDDGKNNLKFIKTRAGNLFALDDSPSAPGVEIVGKKKMLARDDMGAKVKLEDGKIAIGNSAGELLDLFDQLLDGIQNAAPMMVQTAVGPGVLNPALVAKVSVLKAKLAMMKGSL